MRKNDHEGDFVECCTVSHEIERFKQVISKEEENGGHHQPKPTLVIILLEKMENGKTNQDQANEKRVCLW